MGRSGPDRRPGGRIVAGMTTNHADRIAKAEQALTEARAAAAADSPCGLASDVIAQITNWHMTVYNRNDVVPAEMVLLDLERFVRDHPSVQGVVKDVRVPAVDYLNARNGDGEDTTEHVTQHDELTVTIQADNHSADELRNLVEAVHGDEPELPSPTVTVTDHQNLEHEHQAEDFYVEDGHLYVSGRPNGNVAVWAAGAWKYAELNQED